MTPIHFKEFGNYHFGFSCNRLNYYKLKNIDIKLINKIDSDMCSIILKKGFSSIVFYPSFFSGENRIKELERNMRR